MLLWTGLDDRECGLRQTKVALVKNEMSMGLDRILFHLGIKKVMHHPEGLLAR